MILLFANPKQPNGNLTFGDPVDPKSVGKNSPAAKWNPYKPVEVPPTNLTAVSRVKVLVPEVYVFSTMVETPHVNIVATTRVMSETPTTGVMPPTVRVIGEAKAHGKTPKGYAQTPFVRAVANIIVNRVPPIPEVVVMSIPIHRKTHYSYWTPKTVQNLTEEMILTL